jgi:murein DD-endopeptidase MepM/ murein hydrolase activator NlpD
MKKILFLILLCLIQTNHAKKLFKYKDEQGIWHFSDQAPKTEQQIEIRQLKVAQKRYIWLQKTGDKNKPEYFSINNYHGPVEIEISLSQDENVVATPALPNRFIVQPGQSDILFKMAGKNKFKSWHYSLQYRYTLGSSSAHHDDQAIYLPPFAKDSTFQISQAFAGTFSHTDKQNYYAVDIAMPENTPVHAARAGKVMELNNDYFNSGTKQAYKSRANSVRILHKDGSMSVYAHLALEKANVYPGLEIKAGQLIAYSGNTGYSSGPHLHFSVQVNKGMKLVSVPFKFMGEDNISTKPIKGDWLINPK